MTRKGTLTGQQRQAIEQLVALGNISQAAEAVGVSRTTMNRWLKNETFKQALNEAETDALAELRRSLLAMREKAAGAISDVIDDDDAPAWARLRAADIAIKRLLQIGDQVSIEDRLSKLEEQVNVKKSTKRQDGSG